MLSVESIIILNKTFKIKGKLLTTHRSTNYLCCLPTLEDLPGAGRVRLARRKDTLLFSILN